MDKGQRPVIHQPKGEIERDLQALMASPVIRPDIECDERDKPYSWKLRRDAGLILPQLDIDLAATWDLVGHYLEYLLPDTARHKLNPEIKAAGDWRAARPSGRAILVNGTAWVLYG